MYSKRNSVYCGPTLGRQFLALQETYASDGQKSWALNKKYFSGRVGDLVGKDLEKPGVVQARDIAKKEWKIVCRDHTVSYDKKKVIKKMFA